MRERTSALYKIIAGIGMNEMSDSDAAIHYAVMDLNKRGGGANVKDASHIEEYCKCYRDFIKREIEIIDPDIVVWLGIKTYDMELHIIEGYPNWVHAYRIRENNQEKEDSTFTKTLDGEISISDYDWGNPVGKELL